jgi:hypothetical protein
MLAADVTVARRTPSICARNSWVSGNSSPGTRSCDMRSHRAQRRSIGCNWLHAADWAICERKRLCISLHEPPEGFLAPNGFADDGSGKGDRFPVDLDEDIHPHGVRAEKDGQSDDAFVADGCDFEGRAVFHLRDH